MSLVLPFPLSSGSRASRIVLGGTLFGEENETLSFSLLDHFAEQGGKLVDTAHGYANGMSEVLIGRWLRNNPGRLAVIDKLGHPDEHGNADLSLGALRAEAEISLSRMAASRFDILMLHRDDSRRSVASLVETLAWFAESGWARQVGLSNWPAARAEEAVRILLAGGHRPVLSNQFSLAVPSYPLWPGTLHADRDILRIVRKYRVPLLAWSGQARGYFTGSCEPARPGGDDPFDSPENEDRRSRCRLIASGLGIAPETAALAWSLHTQGVLPVVGPRTLAELNASMAAAAVELDDRTLAWLSGPDDTRAPR